MRRRCFYNDEMFLAKSPLAIALLGTLYGLFALWSHRVPLLVLRGPLVVWIVGGLLVAAAGFLVGVIARPETGRRILPAGPRWRWFAVVLVGGWGGYLLFAQPFWRVYFDVGVGLLGVVYSLGLVALPLVGARLPATLCRRVDLATFALVVFVVGAELGLRGVASWFPSPLLSQPDGDVSEKVERLRSQFIGEYRFGFPCNDRGFYDDPLPSGDRRPADGVVAMIGDSFGVGIVPHKFHYTTVAERSLRRDGIDVAIDSVAFPSIGPDEYRYLLHRDVLPTQPRCVVLTLFVGNDFLDASVGDAANRRLRRWFSRENVLLWQVPRRISIVMREPVSDTQVEGIVADEELSTRFPWLDDWRLEAAVFSESAYQQHEVAIASWLCGPDRGQFEPLLQRVDEIRAECGETPLFVVILPDELQVEDRLFARCREKIAPLGTVERDQPQRLLRTFLSDRGIAFLDLLEPLRSQDAELDGDRHLYHLRDTHFNRRGNRVVAEELARFLREQLSPRKGDGK